MSRITRQASQLHLPNLLIEQNMGLGDVVFLEPTIRLLLERNLVNKVTLMLPAKYKELFAGYNDKVEVKGVGNTASYVRQGYKHVRLSAQTHYDKGHIQRYKAFCLAIFESIGQAIDIETIPSPRLSVTEKDIQWGKIHVKHPAILYQLNSFRKEKDIDLVDAHKEIKEYQDKGYDLWVIANDYSKVPPNTYWVKGFDVLELKSLCASVDYYIGLDSGVTWLAGAVNTKGMVRFFTTDEELYLPDNFSIKTIPCLEQPSSIDYAYTPSKTPIANKKIRLSIVIPHLYLGGGETHLLYLLDNINIDKKDIQIIVTGKVDSIIYPLLKRNGYNIEKTNTLKDAITFIIEFNPSVVLHHGDSHIADIISKQHIRPVVIQIMHSDNEQWAMPALLDAQYIDDHVITVANWINKNLCKKTDLPITTIMNGVSGVLIKGGNLTSLHNIHPLGNVRDLCNIPKDAFVIGYLSRLTIDKGIDCLIDAFNEIPIKDIYLLVGGWGDYEIQSKHNIKYLGMVTDQPAFYKAIDAFILPSKTEGNSMAILEAMANRIPVITTNVGAVPELLKDKESCYIIDRNKNSIINGIIDLYNNKYRLKGISDNAYKIYLKTSTASLMASQYLSLMNKELERRYNPKSILCTRNEGLGDILMTTPAIHALRLQYPDAEITYRTYTKHSDLLEGNPDIDKIINMDVPYDKRIGASGFDLSINFEHVEVWDTGEHIIDHYLSLIGQPSADKTMHIYPQEHELNINRPYVVLCPKTNHWAKNWGSVRQWLEIKQYIERYGYRVIILDDYIHNHTIRETAYLIDKAEFIIGLESFSNHLGRALNKKGIIIWSGATTYSIAWYDNFINILPLEDCKCQRSKGSQEPCPYNLKCLKSIPIDFIFNAIRTLV